MARRIASTVLQNHWLFENLFREPTGGKTSWGILIVVVVWTISEALVGNYWLIPLVIFPLAEVYPHADAETAGLLRFTGLCYLILLGVFLVLTSFFL